MKNLVRVLLLSIPFVLLFSSASFAQERTTLNGGLIIEGRTLLPLRSIFETLGAEVNWNSETQTVIATKDQTTISLQLNSKKAIINGQTKSLDIPAKAINGKTMVPVRFIGEAFGADVKWDSNTNIASILLENKVIDVKVTQNNTQTTTQNNVSNSYGNIKGTITWQYNDFVGTKGDVGAKIALIPKNLNKTIDDTTFGLILMKEPQGEDGIYTAEADGYGNFEIQDVPVGEYYLLFSSRNTFSASNVDQYTRSSLQPLFTDKSWENLEGTLEMYKYKLTKVQIKKDKAIVESYDFGNTAF